MQETCPAARTEIPAVVLPGNNLMAVRKAGAVLPDDQKVWLIASTGLSLDAAYAGA